MTPSPRSQRATYQEVSESNYIELNHFMCSYVMTNRVAVAVMLVNCTMGVKVKGTPSHAMDGNEGVKCLSAKRAAHAKLNVRIHGRKDFSPSQVKHSY